MKRRLLLMALATTMVATMFTGCGKESDDSTTKPATNVEQDGGNSNTEEATTKEAQILDENANKYIDAAMKVVKESFIDGSNAGFCDFTLDGIPEFISINENEFGRINSMVFEYKNGEYEWYDNPDATGQGSRIYKNENGNPVLFIFNWSLSTTDDGNEVFQNVYYMRDPDTYEEVLFNNSTYSSKEKDVNIREYYVDGKTLTAIEYFELIYSEIPDKYTYIGDMVDLTGRTYDGEITESSLIEAYKSYLEKNSVEK